MALPLFGAGAGALPLPLFPLFAGAGAEPLFPLFRAGAGALLPELGAGAGALPFPLFAGAGAGALVPPLGAGAGVFPLPLLAGAGAGAGLLLFPLFAGAGAGAGAGGGLGGLLGAGAGAGGLETGFPVFPGGEFVVGPPPITWLVEVTVANAAVSKTCAGATRSAEVVVHNRQAASFGKCEAQNDGPGSASSSAYEYCHPRGSAGSVLNVEKAPIVLKMVVYDSVGYHCVT